MLRIELVLLETGIDFRRIGEGAFQDGGGDGDDFEAVGEDPAFGHGAGDLGETQAFEGGHGVDVCP